MSDEEMNLCSARHRRAVFLLGILCTAGILAAAPVSAGYTCTEVLGQVSFRGLHVVPAMPRVGEEVELQFDIGYAVYSVTRLRLEGTSPWLAGPVVLHGSRQATFPLTAVQAGQATVQLLVTYGTEEQCVDEDGNYYFRLGPDRTVMSPLHVVDIAERDVSCPGDCDGDHEVTIDELVVGVRVALGTASLESCAELNRDGDETVGIHELIGAVTAALTTCRPPMPSPTPTATNPPGMCCCGSYSFVECQALAAAGSCFGWGDPCPTLTPTPTAALVTGRVRRLHHPRSATCQPPAPG